MPEEALRRRDAGGEECGIGAHTCLERRLVSKSQESTAGPLPSTRMTNTVPNLPTVLLRRRGPHANPCYPGLPDFPRSRSLTPWRLEKHLLPRPDIRMEMKAGPAVSKAPKFPCPPCCLAGAKAGSTTLQPKEARSALRFGGLGQNKHPAGEKKALPHLTAASTVSCCSTAGL